jgi:MFS family permease
MSTASTRTESSATVLVTATVFHAVAAFGRRSRGRSGETDHVDGAQLEQGHDRPAGGGPGLGVSLGQVFVAAVRASARSARRLRRWNRRDGAGGSGLASLVEVHALQAAGDATVAVALAGTIFFGTSTDQARTRVALYLLVTMAPFAVVAPLLGPLLDRFRHGRRFALAATMAARATLALVIGHTIGSGGEAFALYPAALGVLIAGKAYGVVRSAAVPRLLPDGMTLVQANSRLTVAAVLSPALAGSVAVGITKAFGHLDALRFGTLLYIAAGLMALRLPRRADGGKATRAAEASAGRGLIRLSNVDPEVGLALRCTAALRWLSGFLLLYGAFVLRHHRLSGLPHNVSLAVLAIGIGAGNLLGTTTGARLAALPTRRLGPPLLMATLASTLLVALDFGLTTVVVIAVVSSATVAMVKLGLDATIQQRVDDSVRTSTFARSETALQLAWVAGGAIGIILPTTPLIGFTVASVVLALATAHVLGVPLRVRAR